MWRPLTVDMMFVVRCLPEISRKNTPLYLWFVDLTKANSIDRFLLSTVSPLCRATEVFGGNPPFPHDMRTWVWLDDNERSDMSMCEAGSSAKVYVRATAV